MGITRQQALDCFASDDLVGIGMEADAVRRRLHPEGAVSYVLDRAFDYTNANDIEDLHSVFTDTLDRGGTGVLLQGTASHSIAWFEQLFTSLSRHFPSLGLHCLSAAEILAIAASSGLSVNDTLTRLRDAGLRSIPGDTRHSALRCSAEDWRNVHHAAHRLGLNTTATLTFGADETLEQRLNILEAVRSLQEETGGFTAFIPWGFQPTAEALEARIAEPPTSVEYLKTLAISRMFLDNIPNIQSSAVNQGLKVLQMSLRFGANDLGSVPMDDPASRATEEELRRIIREAGFRPVERDTLYRTVFLN